MRNINKIIESTNAPQKDSIWIYKGEARIYHNGKWVSIGSSGEDMQKLLERVSTSEQTIKDLIDTDSSISQDIANISSDIKNVSQQLTSTNSTLNQVSTKVNTNTNNISSLTQNLQELNGTVQSNSSEIQSVKSSVQSNTSLITANTNSIETLQNKATATELSIASINSQISSYDAKIQQCSEQITDIEFIIQNISELDLKSYGVKWTTDVADPKLTRIGNPLFHKELPIQSKYRGCIAQGGKVIYYLNPNDWRLKAQSASANITEHTDTTITLSSSDADLLVIDQWVLLNNVTFGQVVSKEGSVLTIKWEGTPQFGDTNSIIIGSVLNGYDGTVRVHTPRFYGKSGESDTEKWVKISMNPMDDTWTEIPEMLIDAYRSTVLQTVPENMGYLSTLEANSAISVVNNNTYCRGGNNNSDYDQYISTDPFRSLLNKPRTNISRASMRSYALNGSSHMLLYEYYKWIFYWAYVIEYANFNSQAAYNAELTSDGYRQGGLGAGVTTWKNTSVTWNGYNGTNPITPCGYCNELGNFTGIKELIIPETTVSSGTVVSKTFNVPRWRGFDNPFGDIWTNLDGIILKRNTAQYSSPVYVTTNVNNVGDTITNKMSVVATEVAIEGFTKYFDLGETGEIVPSVMGAGDFTYKCDYHWCNPRFTALRALRVGGYAIDDSNAGLADFNSNDGVGAAGSAVGFRCFSYKQQEK